MTEKETEKQRILASMMERFMNTADVCRRAGAKGFGATQNLVSAGLWDAAAIEVADLGVNTDTIDKAVGRYLRQIKDPSLHFDHMHNAVHMAKVGASPKVIEEVLRFMLKHYCYIWTINYLEELTALVGRKPMREEIFALAELEKRNQTSWDGTLHETLVALANKYLVGQDIEKVEGMIQEKIREWRSHVVI
ncbi:MAG: hypothetical protein HYX22_00870 [Candidatus Yanofskybacteria bacterium]|nr:hypothetical protein [Candidatus Yanofskybacteria bacterium]